ncbi:MAG: TRAP transporter large permease subunit [Chloroflexi bacterium]|nr:TRAP transporter large permease subunit [Chloroflexota bacterium]
MDWQLTLVVVLAALVLLMLSGLPIGAVLTLLTLVGALVFFGGEAGLRQIILNMRNSVESFTLLPIAMFVLMGEVMFHSGMGMQMLDTLSKWMGRLPGRLSLLAVGFSTLFATMSGSSVAAASLMGSVLKPEMEARGYKRSMSIGPIMGAGGLAIVIPPSGLAVLIAAVGKIPTGQLLISGFVPGIVLAICYAVYITVRCRLQPELAPTYGVAVPSLFTRVKLTAKYVLPLGLIIFLVLGLIFLGIATPTEAAAMGALGSFILAACYRRFSWEMIRKSIMGSLPVIVMVLLIITAAVTFSQILAFSGVARGLTETVVDLPVSRLVILLFMMLIVGVMGCFMEVAAITMITLPIFMPIVNALGFNTVWFGLLFLLNLEMALITPPYGMLLFVMKGVSPDTSMVNIIMAGLPFLLIQFMVFVLIILFPVLALWLPGLMT